MLYKYRGIQNLERTLDIIVSKRVYAALYTELNDPMEGVYEYDPNILKAFDIWAIKEEKLEFRVASFSKVANNTLMWAYYADSHKGLTIGVELAETKTKPVPVDYIGPAEIKAYTPSKVAQQILARKYDNWKHEAEVRVFAKKPQTFVEVEIKEIILGIEASGTLQKIVEAVASQHCPSAAISRIRREDLHVNRSA